MKKKSPIFIAMLASTAFLGVILFLFLRKQALLRYPTVVVISLDTLRADHLGCYGYPRNTSAHIDAFSRESVIFQNAVTVAPKTAPSHMSMFTSLSPLVHGVWNNTPKFYWRLSENIPILPQLLKKMGYFTAGFVQQGNLKSAIGFGRGFDFYKENPRYVELGDWIREVAAVIEKSGRQQKPLFLFVHTNCSHIPYAGVSQKVSSVFLDEQIRGLPGAGVPIRPTMEAQEFFSYFDFSKPEHLRHLIGLYDGSVYFNDLIFEALRKLLIDSGRYDNSVIMLTGDHGEEFLEHGEVFHARLFVETLHVPLIVKFPFGKYAGTRVSAHVSLMDMMPSLLDLLAAGNRPVMQGSSFMPLLTGKGVYDSLPVSYSVDGEGRVRFVKDGYVYANARDRLGEEFLFDFKSDPFEKDNGILKRPETAAKMRAVAAQIIDKDEKLALRLKAAAKKVLHHNPEAVVSELRTLGYAQ